MRSGGASKSLGTTCTEDISRFNYSVPPLPSAGHLPTATAPNLTMVSSGEDAGENGDPQATVFSTVAIRRHRMRSFFMQQPDPRAFRQYLRTLAHPSLRYGKPQRKEEDT